MVDVGGGGAKRQGGEGIAQAQGDGDKGREVWGGDQGLACFWWLGCFSLVAQVKSPQKEERYEDNDVEDRVGLLVADGFVGGG